MRGARAAYPGGGRGGRALGVLALTGLAACAQDRESDVRAQLDGWVVLERTLQFNSSRDCTAAEFETGARGVMSGVIKVRGIGRGLRLIGQGEAVAFDIPGLSPADVHTRIDRASRRIGLKLLSSALAARGCFTAAGQQGFAEALNAPGVVLFYDPGNAALGLFDRDRKRIFYARAEL